MKFSRSILLTLVTVSSSWAVVTRTIDLSASGTSISPYVRGHATRSMPMESGYGYPSVMENSVATANDSMLRGVAGGLIDDMYDWRDPQGQHNAGWSGINTWPVIHYLRWTRDHNCEPLVTANTRGVGSVWGGQSGFVYMNKDVNMLASLAADYVRYTNYIVQTYRMGQAVPAGRDADIISYIRWSHSLGSWNPLLDATEPAVKKVKYWEIGNEPEVAPSSSDPYVLTAQEYRDRYKVISAAMLAEDSTIKVGPCFDGAYAAYLDVLAADPTVRMDFISYHPYGGMLGNYPNIAAIESGLKDINAYQSGIATNIRNILATYGRDTATPIIASEWNPGGPWINGNDYSKTVGQSLGCAETIFSFIQSNVFGATFWIWTDDTNPAIMPQHRVFEALRDYVGDKLIDTYSDGQSLKMYTTKDSKTGTIAIWGLNFSDSTDVIAALNLTNYGPTPSKITFKKFVNTQTGDLSLISKTPESSIDWQVTDLTGRALDRLFVTFDDASIGILVLEFPTCDKLIQSGGGIVTDLDENCRVDLKDVYIFVQYWLFETDPAR